MALSVHFGHSFQVDLVHSYMKGLLENVVCPLEGPELIISRMVGLELTDLGTARAPVRVKAEPQPLHLLKKRSRTVPLKRAAYT